MHAPAPGSSWSGRSSTSSSRRRASTPAKLEVGDSLDPGTQIGPVVSETQLDRVTGYLDIGRDEGARAVAGGHRVEADGLADGYFVEPTLFVDVTDDMRIATEEIFGPVACVMPFDNVDEVVARSNATSFGLAGGVWTKDLGTAHTMAPRLQAGTVWVEHLQPVRPGHPVRRPQDERVGPRVRSRRPRRLPDHGRPCGSARTDPA